jgi:hypothetical protein
LKKSLVTLLVQKVSKKNFGTVLKALKNNFLSLFSVKILKKVWGPFWCKKFEKMLKNL